MKKYNATPKIAAAKQEKDIKSAFKKKYKSLFDWSLIPRFFLTDRTFELPPVSRFPGYT